MLTEKQLKILEKIVNEELKEIKKEGKKDFLTREEYQDYTENYNNNIDEFIEINEINLKERMIDSLISFSKEYGSFEDFIIDIFVIDSK